MLRKLRAAMVRPAREKLSGTVEVGRVENRRSGVSLPVAA